MSSETVLQGEATPTKATLLIALLAGLVLGRRTAGAEAPVPSVARAADESLRVYLTSAHTLRDIHSLKLTRTRRFGEVLKFALVVATAITTTIGYIGTADLARDLDLSEGLVSVVFNGLLMALLILVIAELSWRPAGRAQEHQRAIVVLTTFIRRIEDHLRFGMTDSSETLVDHVRELHRLIIEILPAHTDADYLAAKHANAKKRQKKRKIKT